MPFFANTTVISRNIVISSDIAPMLKARDIAICTAVAPWRVAVCKNRLTPDSFPIRLSRRERSSRNLNAK